MSDLLYSDVDNDLRASVRQLLAAHSGWPTVLARAEQDEADDPGVWQRLGTEIGCQGLAIDEEAGGAGATWSQTAVVLEELGRAVTPVPFLTSAVTATAVASALKLTDLLAELAAGERVAALAIPFADPPGRVTGRMQRDGGQLTGTIPLVAGALGADVLLVPAGGVLYTIRADAVGVRRSPVITLDLTRRLCDVNLDGAEATAIAEGTEAQDAVRHGQLLASALLASEQLGVADRCLEMTVEYLGQRRQFGRILGSYQALKHRLADLWTQVTQARAVARYAAWCAASGEADLELAASLAQAYCSDVAVFTAEECLQLHGGIGFTWEHPAHLYLKRARSAALALGTADWHRARIGDLSGLPAPGLTKGTNR